MEILRCLQLIAVTAILTSCARDPARIDLAEEHLAVHGIMKAGANTAAVLLTWNDPSGRVRPATGARVRLARGDEHRTLESGHSMACGTAGEGLQAGCYGIDFGEQIESGDRFELLVESVEGVRAEGLAMVPAPPIVRSPEAGLVVALTCPPSPICEVSGPHSSGRSVGSFPVAVRTGPEVGRVEIGMTVEMIHSDGQVLSAASCDLTALAPRAIDPTVVDSIAVGLRSVRCADPSHPDPLVWDSLRVQVVVVGYDTVYARYMETVEQLDAVRARDVMAGIQGGAGVFAGAAITRVPIVLQRVQ